MELGSIITTGGFLFQSNLLTRVCLHLDWHQN